MDFGPVPPSGAGLDADRGFRPGPGSGLDPAPGFIPDPDAVVGSVSDPDAVVGSDLDPGPVAGPVFVDSSGRRRKLARRASLIAVAVLAGYVGLLAVSFAGGPIPPNALLPVPGIPAGRQQAPSSSAPAGAAPSGKSSADHVAVGGRSTAGGPEHRASTSGGSAGQSAPSQPQPTSAATTPALPPTPTGASAATTSVGTHGNPSAPGRTRRSKSPSPT
jgi:hypothetical protein